jgi:hypothetical protein
MRERNSHSIGCLILIRRRDAHAPCEGIASRGERLAGVVSSERFFVRNFLFLKPM